MHAALPFCATHLRCVALLLMVFFSFPALAAEKEIYGSDDRIEAYQEQDPAIRAAALAVCALIETGDVVQNGDNTYTIETQDNRAFFADFGDLPLCPEEPFAEQPVAAFCTAFLVAPDIIATAGHCITGERLANITVVFGWELLADGTVRTVIPAQNVYRVTEVVEEVVDIFEDHALMRLDRPVTLPGVEPLTVRSAGKAPDNTPVGLIGHPLGLPKKVAFGARTRIFGNSRPNVFYSNFDASGGNSGSPVFNQQDLLVEGIYVASRVDDFLVDSSEQCFRINREPNEEAGQRVMRSTNFASAIPGQENAKNPLVCAAARGAAAGGAWGDGAILAATCIALLLGGLMRRGRSV